MVVLYQLSYIGESELRAPKRAVTIQFLAFFRKGLMPARQARAAA